MSRSDKTTVTVRINDVVKLILAGAEFADLRQYASDQGWDVSERQIRRYVEGAYKRLARSTKRDRQQLLGRHLMQRRALYARALKINDIRTALQVLRDEASLEGLYPPTKIAPTTPDGKHPYPGPTTDPFTRRQRVVQLIDAEARQDRDKLRLLEQTARYKSYRFPATTLPIQMLHLIAMSYVIEQLEAASMACNALFCDAVEENNEDGKWDYVGMANAYRFRVGVEGWRQFTEKLGVDGDYLVRSNYHGSMLHFYGDKLCEIAPTAEELIEISASVGHPLDKLVTAEELARDWRCQFAQVCSD